MGRRLIARLLLSLGTFAVVAGCSSGSSNHSGMNMSEMPMTPIQVELEWNPTEVRINQTIVFQATVTQDGQAVNDAQEVRFELVNDTTEGESLSITGKSDGNGIYSGVGKIGKAGTYTVTSHVTAHSQHSMPSKTLTVSP